MLMFQMTYLQCLVYFGGFQNFHVFTVEGYSTLVLPFVTSYRTRGGMRLNTGLDSRNN